ncbi:fatty acyl-AMP ligase [Streptomyces muensis]
MKMAGIVANPSVTTVIRQHAENQPEKRAAAFVTDPVDPDGAHWMTYAELDERARSIAVRLRERGLVPGDRALLLYPAGLAFVTAFLGCLYAGVVAVPSPLPGRYRHERHRLRRIMEDAGVTAVLTDTSALGDVREWVTEERLGHLLLPATDDGPGPDAADWRMPHTDHSTLAVLQYTSGSTGDPKGVMISHGNLLHNTANIAAAFGLDDTTRCGGWIPHFHDMGLMGLVIPPLVTGSATVLMSPSAFLKRPHMWLHMVDRFDIYFSAAPDFAYELCSRRVTDAQVEGLDLSRWRHACDGSEPVRSAVLARFHERFAPYGLPAASLAPCYGMAEATLFVSGAPDGPPRTRRVRADLLERNEFRPAAADEPGRELVSCGPPHGAEVRIVDPDTLRTLPEGGVGEIWLRGPVIGHGYWQRDATNEADFRATTAEGDPGYLRTGDLGVLRDGELYITGRIKDVLNLRGRNLYPQDIEQELRLHVPELASLAGACFAVPGDGTQGRDDVLVVTHEVRGVRDEERLRELATGMRLTVAREFGAPVGAVLLLRPGGVRRTTSGKIQRSAMRELFRAGELRPTYADYQENLLRPTRTAGTATA